LSPVNNGEFMRVLFTILCLALAGLTYADNNHDSNSLSATLNSSGGNATANGGTHIQTNTQTAVQTNAQTTISSQGQQQGQVGINKQGQAQGQSADNNGNSQTVNNPMQKLQAPAFAVGYAAPSAPCTTTNGAGLAIPGASGTVGISTVDKPCVGREWFRLTNGSDMGLRTACHMDQDFAKANPMDCARVKQVVAETPVVKKTFASSSGGVR